jgi:hypothetical protein
MTAELLPEDLTVPAVFRYSAFYDLLADAVFQHRHAKRAEDSYIMSRFARASVLASALSVECLANCLLTSLDISRSLFDELDRLTPIAKIETYLGLRAVNGFDRGRAEVQRVAELVKARNDHVHPKASAITAAVSKPQDGGENWVFPFGLDGEHWNQLRIPKRSMFWSATSSLAALGAIAGFYTYLFTALLKATEDELHSILPSRLEIGDAHILAVFEEIRSELQNIEEKSIDFSFFGLFPTPATP